MNKPTPVQIAYVLMNESILLEDRIDYLKKNTKPLSTEHDALATHKDTNDIIDHFASVADPTKNKSHTQYVLGLYRNKAIRQEDAPAIKETLTNFEKYKGKLAPEDRQLTPAKYPKISDVDDKVKPYLGAPTTNAEANAQLASNPHISGKHELKYEDDKVKIYHLKDKDTSKRLYCSTKDKKPGPFPTEWCTARDTEHNMYDEYLERNPGSKYHVVHRKSDGAVFQYHPETQQFQDKDNNDISDKDFESIAPSMHKAWEKHPELL